MKSLFVILSLFLGLTASAQTKNPFLDIYKRDTFSPGLAQYNLDGLVFVIDAKPSEKQVALNNFKSKCMTTILNEQLALFQKLQIVYPGLNSKDFNFQTEVLHTEGTVINGVQLADYICRMNVKINPKGKYKIAPEYSVLFEGKKSENQCKDLITINKARPLQKTGLLSISYYVQYVGGTFGGYKPEYGQVTAIKLMPRTTVPSTLE